MEKKVILEEIGMYADQPAFTCYDHAMATHFADHPLSSSILGSNDSITALTSDHDAAEFGGPFFVTASKKCSDL